MKIESQHDRLHTKLDPGSPSIKLYATPLEIDSTPYQLIKISITLDKDPSSSAALLNVLSLVLFIIFLSLMSLPAPNRRKLFRQNR